MISNVDMKRYRIFSFDFDSRAHSLEPVLDQWDDEAKELHIQNREKTIKGLGIKGSETLKLLQIPAIQILYISKKSYDFLFFSIYTLIFYQI